MPENLNKLLSEGKLDFKCLRCGSCCAMEGYVFINQDDIEAIVGFIGRTLEEFIQKEGNRMRLKGEYKDGCMFYENSECQIYPVRPKQCRTFPVWLENLKYEKYLLEASRYCKGLQRIINE